MVGSCLINVRTCKTWEGLMPIIADCLDSAGKVSHSSVALVTVDAKTLRKI
jgi:hypothetical protein